MGTKIVKMLAGILHIKDACFKCSKVVKRGAPSETEVTLDH